MKHTFKAAKRFVSERGYSLFEQALVMPLLLGFILAAFDVNKSLQSYSVLQEGVKASLRCTYTVDGLCISASADMRPRLYDVYQITSTPEYFGNELNYSGTSSWIDMPNYSYDNIQAHVLNQVRFDLQEQMTRAQTMYHPAEARLNHGMRVTSFPFITGTNPLDPDFKLQGNQSVDYPGAATKSFELDTSITISPNPPSGKVEGPDMGFDLALPLFDDQHCFVSTTENAGGGPANHEPNLGNNCHQNYPGSLFSDLAEDETYIVVYAEGTGSGGSGKVTMELRQNGTGPFKSIGSREFSGSEPANFVPRGAPAAFIKDDFKTAYPEYTGTVIKIKKDRKVRLRFVIENQPGNQQAATWTATNVTFFHPRFISSQTVKPCQGGVSKSDAAINQACNSVLSPIVDPAPVIEILNENVADSLGPLVTLGCSTMEGGVDFNMASFGLNSDDNHSFTYSNHSSCSGAVMQSSSCPAAGQSFSGGAVNYGVPEMPNGNGEITNSATAESICPAQSEGSISNPQNIRWTEALKNVPAAPTVVWNQTSCQQSGPATIPPALQNYPKLHLGAPTLDGHTAHYTGSDTPQEVKANDANFNCSAMLISSKLYDTHAEGVPQHSIFAGYHSPLGCNWENVLQTEAVNLGMNSNSYFEAHTPAAGDRIQFASEPGACIDYDFNYGDPDDSQYLGQFEEGDFPAICQQPDVNCMASFVGFGPGAEGEVEVNFEQAAESAGFNEVKFALPQAQFGCEGANCVNLSVTQDGPYMVSSGEIEIPLTLLLQKTIKLSYSTRKRWEGDFVR